MRADVLNLVLSASLLLTAAIHLLPLAGAFGAAKLLTLYGTVIEDPNIELLMRHRAVLFGLLGTYLLFAAFTPAHQAIGLTAGFISVFSFLLLAMSVGSTNEAIARVIQIDLVAAAALATGGFCWFLRRAWV